MFAVIAEHEERRAVRLNTAVELHTVDDRRHRVFADAEVHISACEILGREMSVNVFRRVLHLRQADSSRSRRADGEQRPLLHSDQASV